MMKSLRKSLKRNPMRARLKKQMARQLRARQLRVRQRKAEKRLKAGKRHLML